MGDVSRILYRAWTGATERADVHRALGGLRSPGRIELRSRLLHLLDESAVLPATLGEPLDEARWEEILRLEHAGDVALGRAPSEAAGPFAELAGLEYSTRLRVVTVHALIGLGEAARQLDDDRCLDVFGRAIDIARADGYRPGLVRALVSCGYALMVKAALVEAGAHFTEAARLAEELNDRTYWANALLGLGETRMRQRDLPAARRHMWAARRVFARLGSPIGLGNVHERLASVFKSEGRLRDAADMLREAEVDFDAAGTVIGRVNVLEQLGDVAVAGARFGEAREAYRRAVREAERHGYRRGRLNALEGLARAAREEGDWPAAEGLYREALEGYREMEDVVGTVRAFDGLALSRGTNAGPAAEMTERVRSIQELERLRAGSDRHDVQVEYRNRFTEMYGAALRCAIDAADLDAAVYLLESLAGRRLAGMVERDAQVPDDGLAAHMLARADQRLLGRLPMPGGTSRQERVKRLLGATAVRGGLAGRAAAEADDAAAALYLPADPPRRATCWARCRPAATSSSAGTA